MNNLRFKIGMSATEVVAEIAKLYLDYTFTFKFYRPYFNKSEMGEANFSIQDLLDHKPAEKSVELLGSEINMKVLTSLEGKCEKREVLGFSSMLLSRGTVPSLISPNFDQLPLMDFNCPKSRENLEKIEFFLIGVNQDEGVILASERSYHFYGTKLLHWWDFEEFQGKCLLSGIADARYIGHRLIDHEGFLRLSASPLRNFVPRVVLVL